MIVTLEEMKMYLRVDSKDEDALIISLIQSAEKLCVDILRTDDAGSLNEDANIKTAILYAVSYMYEHREQADYHALMISLRSLLFGRRESKF